MRIMKFSKIEVFESAIQRGLSPATPTAHSVIVTYWIVIFKLTVMLNNYTPHTRDFISRILLRLLKKNLLISYNSSD